MTTHELVQARQKLLAALNRYQADAAAHQAILDEPHAEYTIDHAAADMAGALARDISLDTDTRAQTQADCDQRLAASRELSTRRDQARAEMANAERMIAAFRAQAETMQVEIDTSIRDTAHKQFLKARTHCAKIAIQLREAVIVAQSWHKLTDQESWHETISYPRMYADGEGIPGFIHDTGHLTASRGRIAEEAGLLAAQHKAQLLDVKS